MPASMRDVAALANVSQRTVSNVVNDYVHVTPETRAKVLRAIDMLGYKPNVTARKLRGGQSNLIALAMPEIAAPYFAELANLIQQEAAARGKVLLIEQTGGTRARELSVLAGYPSAMIDGLIIDPISITVDDLALSRDSVPTVLLGERIELDGQRVQGAFVHVSIDNVAAARTATEHLLGLGRTRIAAVGATPRISNNNGTGLRRTQGYLDALRDAGVDAPPDLRVPVKTWTAAHGHQSVQNLIHDGIPFDALFCFNDTLAIGAMSALHEAGRRIPDDVAVVGWDDIADARYAVPPLTTVAPATTEIAATAVDRLLTLLTEQSPRVDDVTVPFELVVRASTVR
ncbi:LacI family DNA-binding transcriptional regulator [Ruania alba]|uniref:DNA-binding transcriptional regulator, LacI/PurR family n=1 Tax=Ruania alba TaxID=648782 RepID=A0A1H5DDQ6_9MICO|nr:LacI family DNA-binding transcriptional regulator [Ruania alba]SED76870.1 DNA-binding transcriptional regulator, LacI/PurR family [Ruania alba]